MNYSRLLTDKDYFDSEISKINECLQEEKIPVNLRVFHAIMLLSKECKRTIYSNDIVCQKINEWYNNEYLEDKNTKDYIFAYSAIEIKGDFYRIRFPIVFGKCQINFFEFIEIAPMRLQRLSTNELDIIAKEMEEEYEIFTQIQCIREIWEDDLEACIGFLLKDKTVSGNYGMSRWHALQIVEKSLKAYIERKGCVYPYKHDLSLLYAKARELELCDISDELIQTVNCDQSVRYEALTHKKGNDASDKNTAMKAYKNAIKIMGVIGKSLK